MATKSAGEEGFRWFLGVVEDRNDPEKQGRVRVRMFNVHGDKVETPTNTIPWAVILMPGYSSSLKQVGVSATGLQVGSTVFGFFMDGNEALLPAIIGAFPGKGDIPRLAAEQNTIQKELMGPEPSSAYGAKYPYNKVTQTESGHVFEIDDTPNSERLHHYHKSGTYTEINAAGDHVQKIVGNGYKIVAKDNTVYIQGNVNIVVKGNANYTVEGNMSLKVGGSMSVTVGGATSYRYNSTMSEYVAGETNLRYATTMKEYFGGDYYVRRQNGFRDYTCPNDNSRTSGTDCSYNL